MDGPPGNDNTRSNPTRDDNSNDNTNHNANVRAPASPAPSVTLVQGQVLNHFGGGEENVEITLRAKNADGTEGEIIATARSDGMGDFQLTAAARRSGAAVVVFSKAGFATQRREVVLDEGKAPPFVDVELAGNLPLVGSVRDARDDKPIAGAEATLKAVYREWKATSGEDGRFIIKGVPPADAVLVVDAAGFGREQRPVKNVADFGEIIVRLKPERIVHLTIRDEGGAAIPRVTVECLDAGRRDFRTVMTDDEGRVTLRGLHFDVAELEFRLFHDDYVSSTDFDRRLETSPEQVETHQTFVLKRAGRIVGRVVDAETRDPLGGARVVVGSEYSDDSPRDHTGFDGEFTIKGVPPGKTVVTVHRAGFAPELAEVEVQAGAESRVDVNLPAAQTVRGLVLDHEGQPVAGAVVDADRWRGYGTLGLRALTDEHGAFEIIDAPADGFALVVMAPDRATGEVMVQPGQTEIKAALSEPPAEREAGGAVALKPGDAAPEISVKTLDGQEITSASLRGKVVLLDFWATWCGPCVAEVPNLAAVFEAYGGRGDFVMISISLDRRESDLRDFIKKRQMNWRHVFGDAAGANAAADKFGVSGIPAMFLIGPDGKIIATDLRGPAAVDRVGRALRENEGS